MRHFPVGSYDGSWQALTCIVDTSPEDPGLVSKDVGLVAGGLQADAISKLEMHPQHESMARDRPASDSWYRAVVQVQASAAPEDDGSGIEYASGQRYSKGYRGTPACPARRVPARKADVKVVPRDSRLKPQYRGPSAVADGDARQGRTDIEESRRRRERIECRAERERRGDSPRVEIARHVRSREAVVDGEAYTARGESVVGRDARDLPG